MPDFSHIPEPYRSAYKACSRNKGVVGKSKMCGCFSCLNIYPSTDVVEWIEENDEEVCEAELTNETRGLKSQSHFCLASAVSK